MLSKLSIPELKVVRFGNEDVIATSLGLMSADAYRSTYMNDPYTANGFAKIDGEYNGYVGVIGQMVYYDSSAEGWYFYGTYSYIDANPDEYKSGYSNYDVYDLYNDGTQAYTKGASYYEIYGN